MRWSPPSCGRMCGTLLPLLEIFFYQQNNKLSRVAYVHVMSITADYLRKRVSVVTCDGRHYLGTLESCDQVLNLVLSSCVERIHTTDAHGAEDMPLGVFLIRGAGVVCVGAVDTIEEATIDVRSVRGPPLGRCTV